MLHLLTIIRIYNKKESPFIILKILKITDIYLGKARSPFGLKQNQLKKSQ